MTWCQANSYLLGIEKSKHYSATDSPLFDVFSSIEFFAFEMRIVNCFFATEFLNLPQRWTVIKNQRLF